MEKASQEIGKLEIGKQEIGKLEISGADAVPASGKPIRELSPSADSLRAGEKGSLLSMWEILLQLRVLLPYLSRLAPLLDRGVMKPPPELLEIRKSLADTQASLREWVPRAKIQADQLDRIEAEMSQLRAAAERNAKQSRDLADAMRAVASRILLLTVILSVLMAVLILLQIPHWVHPRP